MFIFFFNDTATTEIYTLSLHDALPISRDQVTAGCVPRPGSSRSSRPTRPNSNGRCARSEEHTSELQSRQYLVCRLLLEKKKITLMHLTSRVIIISIFLNADTNLRLAIH